MSKPILSNLVFTRSTGRRDNSKDTPFNDAIEYGEFPADFKIKGIKQVDVFSDQGEGDNAIITGFTIKYDGIDDTVSHGTVVKMDNVGTLTIDPEKNLLVGIYGRLKDLDGEKNDKRIASIGFVVFDKRTGKVETKGPWQGSTESLGTPWATFGPVVAFQGTAKDGVGLTTLGFVKSVDAGAANGIKMLANSNKSAVEEPHVL